MDKSFFNNYIDTFLNQNATLNLISKNDEKYLWEKHIFDSLAIKNFFEKYKLNLKGKSLLDIGTGGGFPAIPVAMCYPDMEVFALDSIRKKINAIENIKAELKIKNLHTICNRAENIKNKYDFITSRAVASLKIIAGYSLPLLKNDGYFVAYKSIRAEEEIEAAKQILKKYNAGVIDILKYDLPLKENYTRNLIIIKSFAK